VTTLPRHAPAVKLASRPAPEKFAKFANIAKFANFESFKTFTWGMRTMPKLFTHSGSSGGAFSRT
jgi:hypothetical protein